MLIANCQPPTISLFPKTQNLTISIIFCLAACFSSSTAYAGIDIRCQFSMLGIASATGTNQMPTNNYSSIGNGSQTIENCNQSANIDFAGSTAYASGETHSNLSQSLVQQGESYIFHAEGSTNSSAFSSTNLSGYYGQGLGVGRIGNSITFTSRTPFAFELTINAAGVTPYTNYSGDQEGIYISNSAGLILPSFIGDLVNGTPQYFHTSGILSNTKDSSGYYALMLVGAADSGGDPRTNGYGTASIASSASWDYTLTLTPVPLPAAIWFMLSGIFGLGLAARKRA